MKDKEQRIAELKQSVLDETAYVDGRKPDAQAPLIADLHLLLERIKELERQNAALLDALVLAKIQGSKADRDRIIDPSLAASQQQKGGEKYRPELAEAIEHHNGKWPEKLYSGVMFFKGVRITKVEFDAATNQGGQQNG